VSDELRKALQYIIKEIEKSIDDEKPMSDNYELTHSLNVIKKEIK